jgi:prepilin-type N-terminal cleavage/methylation domain-containing protein
LSAFCFLCNRPPLRALCQQTPVSHSEMELNMNSNKRAFTLMELLVVVAIIGILVSIAIPALGFARALAQRAGCKATLKGVGSGLAMYLTANHNRYPDITNMPSQGINDLPGIAEGLEDYLGGSKPQCPGDRDGYYETEGSSYEFNTMLCGEQLDDTWLGERLGDLYTPVMWDYGWFHGDPGQDLGKNFLYANGVVMGLGENE